MYIVAWKLYKKTAGNKDWEVSQDFSIMESKADAEEWYNELLEIAEGRELLNGGYIYIGKLTGGATWDMVKKEFPAAAKEEP